MSPELVNTRPQSHHARRLGTRGRLPATTAAATAVTVAAACAVACAPAPRRPTPRPSTRRPPARHGTEPRAGAPQLTRDPQLARPPAHHAPTLALGGDVLLGRGVAARARRASWARPPADIAPALRAASLALVNLESPLAFPHAPCLPGGTVQRPRLCAPPAAVPALRAAGIDAVSVANNHALDAGPAGLRHTARHLARAGIAVLGLRATLTGVPRAEPLGPWRVVAVNLTRPALPPGRAVPLPSPADVARTIRRSTCRHPFAPVILFAHLGREHATWSGPRENAYARAAITAGASAVVYQGAHVRRRLVRVPLSRFEGAAPAPPRHGAPSAQPPPRHGAPSAQPPPRRDLFPVHLGLGNLLFDQRDPRTHLGEVLTLALPPRAGLPARVMARQCVQSYLTGRPTRCPSTARVLPSPFVTLPHN